MSEILSPEQGPKKFVATVQKTPNSYEYSFQPDLKTKQMDNLEIDPSLRTELESFKLIDQRYLGNIKLMLKIPRSTPTDTVEKLFDALNKTGKFSINITIENYG